MAKGPDWGPYFRWDHGVNFYDEIWKKPFFHINSTNLTSNGQMLMTKAVNKWACYIAGIANGPTSRGGIGEGVNLGGV